MRWVCCSLSSLAASTRCAASDSVTSRLLATGSASSTLAMAPPFLIEQTAQHILHDAAVPVVGCFAGRVDTHQRLEFDRAGAHLHTVDEIGIVQPRNPDDIEGFLAGQAECLGILPFKILQWQHAHTQQV